MDGLKTLFAKNITKTFSQGNNPFVVLNGITESFEQGKSYGIVGVSGSGKSTFMHILGGLDHPSSGNVLLFNQPIHKNTKRDFLLNKSLGFVFQFHYLVKELSVIENVMLPGLIGGMSRSAATHRAIELLDFLSMTHKANAHPSTLSGGEQQRISIIRAMFNRPAFLIADEPTGNLDEENAKQAVKLLLNGCATWNMGLILCSHDQHVYDKMQIIFRMHQGVLVQEK